MMENRFDFLFRFFPTTLTLLVNVLVVNFVFTQVKEIAGWNRNELLFLTGTYYIVWGLFFGPFIQNLSKINTYINRGDLDLFLTKPVDSQFYSSVRLNVDFGEAATILTGAYLVIQSAIALNLSIDVLGLIMYCFLIINGAIVAYAVWFISMTTSFWLGRIPDLHEAFLSVASFGRFPVDIFQGSLKNILIFILPVGVMFTFPAQFLLKTLSAPFIVWSFGASIGFLCLSHWFWNFALKHYSSASS